MSWRALQPSEDDGEIRHRLLSPQRSVTLAELAALWTSYTLTYRIEGVGSLIGDFALPGRLRGAFGEALLAGASDAARSGRPCDFDPPCAFEALFRKQGRMTAGLDLASPWVIALDTHRADLVISLRLFGFAIEWAPAAAEAMTRCIRELVDWPHDRAATRTRPQIKHRSAGTTTGELPTVGSDGVELDLLSPLAMTGRDPREQPELLITGLGSRVSALARWHDVTIDEDTDWRSIKACARGLAYKFLDSRSVSWTRRSGRQGRLIPMRGITGRVVIDGKPTPDVRLLLGLGSTCHMGADIALGCGRYRIT